jgi:hypothetical protein
VTIRSAPGWATALLVAGCATDRTADRLEVGWQSDSLSGRLAAPAVATWCTGRGRLLVSASAGDSGFAVTVLPADSLAVAPVPGSYPVGDPGAARILRPSAALALRRQEESRGAGYQSRSGSLDLAPGEGGGWRAEFDGRIVSITGNETLAVRGEFRLAADPVAEACDDTVSAGAPTDTLP